MSEKGNPNEESIMSVAASSSESVRPFSTSWSARGAFRVRLGTLCLLFAASTELLGLVLRGPLVSPGGAPNFFMQVSASPTLHLGWGLLMSSAMLQCFGWLAVYRWRRDSRDERLAFWAMILTIVSIVTFLPVSGALGFTSHEAALAEAAGQRGAVELVARTAEGPFARQFLIVSVLTGLVAVGLWARVLWRVSALPRWVAVFLIVHTITQSITSPMFPPWGYRLERVGALAFMLAAATLVLHSWRDTAPATER
jgi:hypothetical protein